MRLSGNLFMVGMQGDNLTILRFGAKITKEEALNLAANLVAMADFSDDHADFKKALEDVENS